MLNWLSIHGRGDVRQADYLLLVDNASGDFLRAAPSASAEMTTEGAAAALVSFLEFYAKSTLGDAKSS